MLFHHKPLKREVYSVIYLWFSIGGILCQLLKTDCRLSAGCILWKFHKAGLGLSAGGVLCQLHEFSWWLSAGVYSVSYMSLVGVCMQGCTLSVTWVYLTVVYRGCVNSVSYIRQINSCLQGVCELCHILETGWNLYARVRILRRLLDKDWRLSTAGVLCQLHKAGRRFFAKGGVICQSTEPL